MQLPTFRARRRSLLRFRRHGGNLPVGRVHNQRSAQAPDHLAALEPEIVNRAAGLKSRRSLAGLLGHSLLIFDRFRFGKELLPGELLGPLQRRDGRVGPESLEVWLAVARLIRRRRPGLAGDRQRHGRPCPAQKEKSMTHFPASGPFAPGADPPRNSLFPLVNTMSLPTARCSPSLD